MEQLFYPILSSFPELLHLLQYWDTFPRRGRNVSRMFTQDWLIASLVSYCDRTNFRTRFNFVYFVLLAESTKYSSIRKPYTYTSVSDTTVAVRKFLAYESRQTLEYEIFTCTKISAITVIGSVHFAYSSGWQTFFLFPHLCKNETNISLFLVSKKMVNLFLEVFEKGGEMPQCLLPPEVSPILSTPLRCVKP